MNSRLGLLANKPVSSLATFLKLERRLDPPSDNLPSSSSSRDWSVSSRKRRQAFSSADRCSRPSSCGEEFRGGKSPHNRFNANTHTTERTGCWRLTSSEPASLPQLPEPCAPSILASPSSHLVMDQNVTQSSRWRLIHVQKRVFLKCEPSGEQASCWAEGLRFY